MMITVWALARRKPSFLKVGKAIGGFSPSGLFSVPDMRLLLKFKEYSSLAEHPVPTESV
jgi:hypothetical protein